MKIKGFFAVLAVFGTLFLIGCTTPTEYVCGNDVCDGTETCATCPKDCGACPLTGYCGDGTCDDDETCATCESDCGQCPAGGKDVLMGFMREVYDKRVSTGTSYSEGREITFDVGDDVTDVNIARSLGLYFNRVTLTCSYNMPDLDPDAALGCVDFEGIAPIGASTAYVYASCAGDSIQCTVDFQTAA